MNEFIYQRTLLLTFDLTIEQKIDEKIYKSSLTTNMGKLKTHRILMQNNDNSFTTNYKYR